MKILKIALLPTAMLMLCGAGSPLFAPPMTYDFFPIEPDFSAILTLDSGSNPSGTSADVVSWDIVDPSGEFTPSDSSLEPGGIVDWNPSTITSMDLVFDANGNPAVTLTASQITKDIGDHSTDTGAWTAPETNNSALLLLMTAMALGGYHLFVQKRKAVLVPVKCRRQ